MKSICSSEISFCILFNDATIHFINIETLRALIFKIYCFIVFGLITVFTSCQLCPLPFQPALSCRTILFFFFFFTSRACLSRAHTCTHSKCSIYCHSPTSSQYAQFTPYHGVCSWEFTTGNSFIFMFPFGSEFRNMDFTSSS